MLTEKIEYEVLKAEFHGLLVFVKKKNYKLYISNNLLLENNLDYWQFDVTDYYKDFIEKNIETFVEDIEKGNCLNIYDGFSIGG